MGNEIHVYYPHEVKVRKFVSDIPPYGYNEVTTYRNSEPILRWTPDGQRVIYTKGLHFKYIEKLKGRILVVHGSGDYNAPMTEFDKPVNVLMKAEKEFDYMVLPQEPHGWVKPRVKRDFFRRVERFLDSYLRYMPSN